MISGRTGQTLLTVLQSAGIYEIEAPCGGNGKCGKCLVQVTGAISPSDSTEERLLPHGEARRLACRTRIEGDCTVFLAPEGSVDAFRGGLCENVALKPIRRQGLGAAVDIGTTTVVLYLVDLATGEIINTQSGMNKQRIFGADVISRVEYTTVHEDGLNQLSDTILTQIDTYLRQACREAEREIGELREIAIACNTVMAHILTGLPPKTIAVAPFTPISLFGKCFSAASLGLHVSPDVSVYVSPCIAGYVGGDITAGLFASGAYMADGTCLYLDIGTNGEIALGNRAGFLCCATAAGPAFEGAEIACGSSGVTGAISSVRFSDGAVGYQVIGGGVPTGICGSGLVDTLAMLLKLGAVDETGRSFRWMRHLYAQNRIWGSEMTGLCFISMRHVLYSFQTKTSESCSLPRLR